MVLHLLNKPVDHIDTPAAFATAPKPMIGY